MLFDTHCHVQFQAYSDDREEVIQDSLGKGVIMNMVGTQKDTSRAAVELAEAYNNVYASIGTHPIHLHSTHVDEEESSFQSREEDFDDAYYETLYQSSKKIIGVGETGLDLFHLPADVSVEQVLEKQRKVFLAHVAFAMRHNLPLVVHCRDAHDQMVEVLHALDKKPRGTIHCYTSDWIHAKQYLEMGFYLGFTGVITFPPKKSNPKLQEDLLEVVRNAPLDRILLETDSPYLTPNIRRGKRNEPWLVEEVAKKIAELRDMPYEEVAAQTTKNAKELFGVVI